MLKKIVLLAVIMLPAFAFAQESQKITYVNRLDVIYAMPEFKQMQDSLAKSDNEFQAEFKILQEEYYGKYADYIAKRDSLNESIRLRREQELTEIAQRTESFQQFAQQKQEELQQALITPILTKFQKAVEDVGKENNYLYIIDSTVLTYTSANATDATPLIKRKLGIQ